MPHDPRILIGLFDEVARLLLRWTTDVAGFDEATALAVRQTREAVDSLGHRTRAVEALVGPARPLAGGLHADTAHVGEAVDIAAASAHMALTEVEIFAGTTHTLASEWQVGLNRATDTLRRAQEQLTKARQILAQAEQYLREAELSLQAARTSLGLCENFHQIDQQGRRIANDCSFQRNEMARALGIVTACQSGVAIAHEAVREAQTEERHWQGIVDRCTHGLATAHDIAASAQHTIHEARDAVAVSDRACSERHAAHDLAREAAEAVERLEAIASEGAAVFAVIAGHSTEMPAIAGSVASIAREQGMLHAGANRLLIELEDQLRRFDAATLGHGA